MRTTRPGRRGEDHSRHPSGRRAEAGRAPMPPQPGRPPSQAGVRVRVAVFGIIGRTPFAGVAWQALHYLEGLRRLGCEVTYIEDTGTWPYDAERNTTSDDPASTIRYLERVMS